MMFQRPDNKPGSTVVITGEKGTGKSTLFDYINQLLGRHGITVSQRKQIVGQFNGHLATTLLMVCEEAFWAADPQAEGVLKDMITNKSVLIEKKGYDPIQSQNYTRLALISNSDWVVPASLKDERRFFVLRCSNAAAGRPRLLRRGPQADGGAGGLEAMLYDLMNWKPSTAPSRRSTRRRHLAPPAAAGRDALGVQKFMLELIRSGVYETHDDKVPPIELNRIARRSSTPSICGPRSRIMSASGSRRTRPRPATTTSRSWCRIGSALARSRCTSMARPTRSACSSSRRSTRPALAQGEEGLRHRWP
jgi:energy-coupling factor transporter ATP-binding protein EcfA2